MSNQPRRRRILIPREHWTPVVDRVFSDELGELEEKSAAALYLFLIDSAYHRSRDREARRVVMTRAEISAATGMDERVVKRCLAELSSKGFIQLERRGAAHSHINKDCWSIPAVDDVSTEIFTPVPRLIIREYLPAYRNAVLLAVLLFHQHMNWRNRCWMGVERLSKLLKWSPTSVRSGLRRMMYNTAWGKLGTGLPTPLAVCTVPQPQKSKLQKPAQRKAVRHYSVLAVRYTGEQNPSRRRIYIPKTFRDHFEIELTDDLRKTLSSIFRSTPRRSSSPKNQKVASA